MYDLSNFFPKQILGEEQFKYIEKIKSTGSTYMAASGVFCISPRTVSFKVIFFFMRARYK